MADKDLKALHQNLINTVSKGDYASASKSLSALKIALLERNALIPSQSTPVPTLLVARDILEVGALASIHQPDDSAFSRYYSQLQPFYEDPRLSAPGTASTNRSKITGLHLLLLLSRNEIADFHTTLENLEAPEDDPFIKHPIMLERWLMEGSYDKVWNATKSSQVPSEEYAHFSQVGSR
jgi:26S proteasome regulatory subunit N12